jgi:hypothetical protein
LIDIGDEAESLDWIGKPGQEDQVWANLKGKLNNAQSHIENKNCNNANEELTGFLTAVEDYYDKTTQNMTSEGYALLKYNAEYLIQYLRTLVKQ